MEKFTEGETVWFDGKSADGKVTGYMPVTVVDSHSNYIQVAGEWNRTKTDKWYEKGGRTHIPTATVKNQRAPRLKPIGTH